MLHPLRGHSSFFLGSVAVAVVGVFFLTPLVGRQLVGIADPVPDYHRLYHGVHSALLPDVPTVLVVPLGYQRRLRERGSL